MPEPPADGAALPGVDALAQACRWLADAHALDDPESVVAATCELYRVLAARGWQPPRRAAVLLRVHAAVLDADLARSPDGSARAAWGRASVADEVAQSAAR